MKKYNIKYFSECLAQNISEVVLLSRLTWKNIVFKLVNRDGKAFAIKIFQTNMDSEERFQTELTVNKLILDSKLNAPKVIEFGYTQDKDRYILYEWVYGESLKSILLKNKEYGLKFFDKIIKNIHLLSDKFKCLDREALYVCTGSLIAHNLSLDKVEINKILDKCRGLSDVLHSLFRSKYFNLLDYATHNLNNKTLINSDISCKEFIIDTTISYLDYESYCMGDINADYAGLFYSSVNGFFDDNNWVEKYYAFFKSQKDFNNNLFLFYLSERVIMAEILAQDQVSIEEYLFFIKFILNNLENMYI